MASNAELIKKLYDSNLQSQKATLQQDYDQGMADLDAQQKKTQQQTDQNLTRTHVEAAKAGKNYGEVQNAYGLTSGAMAQARLAQDTDLQQDLTALRGVQANVDAQIERDRTLRGQAFANAIAKAQADNDMARAEALYKEAQAEEDRLADIAALFAQRGDYSYYKKLYNLTDQQMKKLMPRISSGGSGNKSSGSTSSFAVSDLINAAVREGTSQSSTKASVNAIVNAAVKDGVMSAKEAAAYKSQNRGYTY